MQIITELEQILNEGESVHLSLKKTDNGFRAIVNFKPLQNAEMDGLSLGDKTREKDALEAIQMIRNKLSEQFAIEGGQGEIQAMLKDFISIQNSGVVKESKATLETMESSILSVLKEAKEKASKKSTPKKSTPKKSTPKKAEKPQEPEKPEKAEKPQEPENQLDLMCQFSL